MTVLSFLLLLGTAPLQSDTVLTPSSVSAVKQSISLDRLAAPSTTLEASVMQAHGISSQASFAAAVPGLYIPEYGASLTSTIYVRGLGSRMDNPVVGYYIDDIPIIDKNAYDFDWNGVGSASFLRGPQGTLYGRNSMCGILSLHSTGPRGFGGPMLRAEYGSASSLRVSAEAASGNSVFGAGLRRSDGFFQNEYDGRMCDPYLGGNFRWKWESGPDDRLRLSNSLNVFVSDEGGFAYGLMEDGVRHEADYDGEGSYRRVSLLEGFKLSFSGQNARIDGMASLQLLADRMRMDQDYSPVPVFTLEQRQRSAALTFELIARPARSHAHWKPQTGFFAMGKANSMHAPVEFLRDGIQTLILDNANSNIPGDIGHLDISDDSFTAASEFGLFNWDAALYHESLFEFGRWVLTAGMRLELEGAAMNYDSEALVHYRFVPTMAAHKAFSTAYKGSIFHIWPVLLPKLSAVYDLPLGDGRRRLKLYASATKGFRAGGFNTQIFSDILQNMMMNGLMKDLGVYFDRPMVSVGAGNTEYRPEQATNFELGARFGKGTELKAELCAFLMQVEGQQLTVFPPGMSTGRMMANAGKSRSHGAEAELSVNKGRFHAILTGSWAEARFTEYDDGNNDYAGRRIPYSPRFTLFAGAGCDIPVSGSTLGIGADLRGAGPFEWNEANTLREPFTPVFGARISLRKDGKELYLRGENLADASYHTFYFRSMSKDYLAAAKPRRIYAGLSIKL
ncbi:MAG: TonB-dependent receptor [Bacteroidales bacterium]|nr:TonB-dependent receptor [Bacteroidales bacterium]